MRKAIKDKLNIITKDIKGFYNNSNIDFNMVYTIVKTKYIIIASILDYLIVI